MEGRLFDFFYILPFLVSILVVVIKKKIVNAQNGRKFAKREMLLDGVRILTIALIAMIANILVHKDIPVWTLTIDIFMMIVYVLPLLQKNYDYIERKSLMGIWATCIFMLTIAIAILQMLLGTYDNDDATLVYCFIKGLSYFLIALWVCFTTGKDNKVRSFFSELKSSFINYNINTFDYYMIAILALFIFTGGNNNFYPVGIFGIHEILNKKRVKGIIYIILGNISIFINSRNPLIGSFTFMLYTLIALVDLLIQFVRFRKTKL